MTFTYDDYIKQKKKRIASATKNGVISLKDYAEIEGIDLSKIGRTAERPQTTVNSTMTLPTQEEKERTWFQESKGNLLQTVVGSGADLVENAGAGILGMGESILDGLMTIQPYFEAGQKNQSFNFDINEFGKSKENASAFIQQDLYDEKTLANQLVGQNLKKNTGIDTQTMSVFGDKSDALAQSAGQLVGQLGVNALLPGAGLAVMGVSAFGGEMENALNQGATYEEAVTSGTISAGAEILTEKLFGYFGAKGMDDVINKTLANKLSNATARTLAKIGVDASGEGAEEVLSGVVSAIGQKLTYMDEKELNELFSKEDALESFVGGAVLGSVGGGVEAAKAKNAGKDMVTGLTKNEQAVVDAIAEERFKDAEKNGKKLSLKEKSKIRSEIESEMDDGVIDIDKIESILGGDDYKTYKDTAEKESRLLREEAALKDAPNTIGNAESIAEIRRQIKELKDSNATQTARDNLYSKVQEMTKNDRLVESYNEKGRRGKAYEADLTQYEPEQQAVIQKAIDSGILNNTNRTHKFVDMIAKISADKGVSFDFTNNQKLKESGFALEGKTVNGFIQDGNISLNINSAKALNKVVGHEITHVLEGTELYSELQDVIIEYAKGKGDYDSRWESIVKLYRKQFEGQMTDERMQQYKAELTADLVGDYLFSDPDFVNKLSAEQPTIFQKIYDEIKYMVKVATAGSKEAKQLLEVQRAFEKAYKESGTEDNIKDGIRYSLAKNAETELKKALTDKNYNSEVLLRDETPAILLSHKGVKNLPMTMKASHIRENVFTEEEAKQHGLRVDKHTHYHGLGDAFFLKVIDGLDNVKLAYRGTKNAIDSSRRENYFLLISEFKDENGNTVNVPVYIDEHALHNQVFIDVNKISTVFGRDKFDEYISRQVQNGNLVRIKNKSIQSSESNALIARDYRKDTSKDSISQDNENATANYKKSLGADETSSRNDVYGTDIMLDIPTRSDIAPVQKIVDPFEDIPVRADVQQSEVWDGTEESWEAYMKQSEEEYISTLTEEQKQKLTRKKLHEGIMNKIKAKFAEHGWNFDVVLSDAKNKSTFASVDNTPQRFLEKSLGYKQGQLLSELTVEQTALNETEAIKWLNSYVDKKNGLLAKLAKEYKIKPGSKESAAAQMYGEGFYVNAKNEYVRYGDAELAKDFPNIETQERIKGLATDSRVRQIYDDTLDAINASRKRNAYPEIPRRNDYFLHFMAMEDTFSRLGVPFNPNDIRSKDLPTDINGVTADLKPGQPYFASANQRKGVRTTYDLLGGVERYLNSAKNQIYHIDDIQTLRALRNYVADTFGQAKGFEGLDELSQEDAKDRIEQIQSSHLSVMAKFLNEQANTLAGKTTLLDRSLEGLLGRRAINFLDTVNKQVGSNMVGGNISSSLTNFVSVIQGFAKTNKYDAMKAVTQTITNRLNKLHGVTDGFEEKNPLIIRRKGSDRLVSTPWETARDMGYILSGAVDSISTELIVRAKYNELIRKGATDAQAHGEAAKWAARILGDRSYGQQPQLFNSKMLGIVTKFQLEVRNQLDSMFYDTIQEANLSTEEIQNGLEKNARKAAKITSTLTQLAVGQHLFGAAFEAIVGYNPTFDIIENLITLFGWDDDEDSDDTWLDNTEQAFQGLLEDLPYTSTFTGGRIPISSALPVEEFFSGKDQYGNEKSRVETVLDALPYYVLPTGYGQMKKSLKGIQMFDDDLPIAGSYTDSGKLRFSVDDDIPTRLQAAVFGQYASENARDYFDNGRSPLTEKQTRELVMLDIPIKQYWKYRQDLKKIEADRDGNGNAIPGSKKQKILDYIDSQDIDLEEKMILFKYQYPADNTYNYQILEYLKTRTDITDAEKKVMLKDLNFIVGDDGSVRW